MSVLGGWPAYAHSESGRQERISQQEGDRARVTVTAFVNISGNPSDDWWGIGIAEVVAIGLNEVAELEVKRPVLSEELRSIRDGGVAASGTHWVITGTYQHFENQIRLTAQVSDVVDGSVLQSVIVDGTVRDLAGIRRVGMPTYAWGTVPGHGQFNVTRFDAPLTAGQLRVHPGDLLFADGDGCQHIPNDRAEEVLEHAKQVREKEAGIFEFYGSPGFTVADMIARKAKK